MSNYDGISVIICTYNSSKRIVQTLRYLFAQKISTSFDWEIILINNRSTDATALVAYQTWRTQSPQIQFSILHEDRPGKIAAFKAGVKSARFQYILICDDDNWLPDNYLQTAYGLISADSSIGAVGARGIPVVENSELPSWFDEFKISYATGEQLLNSNDPDQPLYGAGLVLRKDPIVRLLGLNFDFILTDRCASKKKPIIGGGDDEICYVLRLMGFQLKYHESLYFYHCISCDRLSFVYLKRLYRGYGITVPLLQPYRQLLLSRRTGKEINAYFWTVEIGRSMARVATHLLDVVSGIARGRDMKKEKLELIFHFCSLKQYIIYNFQLTKRTNQLKEVFKPFGLRC